MVERDAQVIVSGARRSNIEYYLQYLFKLWQRRPADTPMFIFARGFVLLYTDSLKLFFSHNKILSFSYHFPGYIYRQKYLDSFVA